MACTSRAFARTSFVALLTAIKTSRASPTVCLSASDPFCASSPNTAPLLQVSAASKETNTLWAQGLRTHEILQKAILKTDKDTTRTFLQTLHLCHKCQEYQRFGEAHDGGYAMCMDDLNGLQGALSLGVNGFDGWGSKVAELYGIPVHEFDCYNQNVPAPCAGCQMNFHPQCIIGESEAPRQNFITLSEMLNVTGLASAPEASLLLKIDVEAAEWQVFADEPVSNLDKFKQLVVEFHWLGKDQLHDLYLAAVKKIEQAGFVVTHLHGNNNGGLDRFGDFSVPDVLEVTYVRGNPGKCEQGVPYRLPQDAPNNAGAPELGNAELP